MTENRKQVRSVNVTESNDAQASIKKLGVQVGVAAQSVSTTVTVAALPVKPVARDHYVGPYIVEPSMDEQTLDTKQKLMDDDVTVREIRVTYTSNLSGGNTVYIGAQGI